MAFYLLSLEYPQGGRRDEFAEFVYDGIERTTPIPSR